MYTERIKKALAVLLICSAAAVKLAFPTEVENIKKRGAELIGVENNYRNYIIGVGTRISRTDVGQRLENALERIETGLLSVTEIGK